MVKSPLKKNKTWKLEFEKTIVSFEIISLEFFNKQNFTQT